MPGGFKPPEAGVADFGVLDQGKFDKTAFSRVLGTDFLVTSNGVPLLLN